MNWPNSIQAAWVRSPRNVMIIINNDLAGRVGGSASPSYVRGTPAWSVRQLRNLGEVMPVDQPARTYRSAPRKLRLPRFGPLLAFELGYSAAYWWFTRGDPNAEPSWGLPGY